MLEGVGVPLVHLTGGGGSSSGREQRRPMWTQHEKAVLRLLMRQYAGVTEFDPPDVHKHPIRNEMWRLLTARYNAHPHVRSRDTKQLRKAWENLKYRARKLGNEAAKSGSGGGGERQASSGGPEGASWPLEGAVAVSPGRVSPPPRSTGEQFDCYWKQGKVEENGMDSMEEGGMDIKDEVSDDSETTPGEGVDGAVLNLHPLVSSLLGGGLGSLATSLSLLTSAHPARILLTQPNPTGQLGDSGMPSFPGLSPFKRLIVSTGDSSHGLPDADLSATTATSSSSPCPVNISSTSENHLSSNRGNDDSAPGITCSPAGGSSPPPPSSSTAACGAIGLSSSERLAALRVSAVELQMRQLEEQHAAGLQLLRVQIGQAVAEHEAKMRVLALQLEYWQQRRVRGHRGAATAPMPCANTDALTLDDQDDDYEPIT